VSFVDARDVGRVAAAALLAGPPPEPVLDVTGPEALTWFDVASTMSQVLGRPITHYPTPPDVIRQAMLAMGRPTWLVEHMLELAALLREPEAAEVTGTVERMTGQPATTLREFLADHASAFLAPRNRVRIRPQRRMPRRLTGWSLAGEGAHLAGWVSHEELVESLQGAGESLVARRARRWRGRGRARRRPCGRAAGPLGA